MHEEEKSYCKKNASENRCNCPIIDLNYRYLQLKLEYRANSIHATRANEISNKQKSKSKKMCSIDSAKDVLIQLLFQLVVEYFLHH